ncbi:MAG: cell division protein FtsZ [Bacteroidetes bacterium]|nr:cell division protein FtsZ [Bacteroidota bacterium]
MEENSYMFDIPKHHKSIIKVIGVGGGGSNAVNHMYNLGIKDVEFIVCNTDLQALESSPLPGRLQIGANLTGGLGAGANPEKGRNAALESKEDIRELLSLDTKMLFITAGMGGGTGTGAAPVIAKVARELDILTVGIITMPFAFEGKKKMEQALLGVQELKECCDTVLTILNDKLREIYGNLSISEAFAQADNVLTTAAKGIAEIITVPGYVNVDFEDVKTVMENSGAAVMGSAQTEGENRAIRAAEEAITSPLLNNKNIHGCKKILLSIISGEQAELQMDELTEITEFIQQVSGDEADVIFGHGVDPELEQCIRVTVIATGFDSLEEFNLTTKDDKKVFDLESNQQISLFESSLIDEFENGTPKEEEMEIKEKEIVHNENEKEIEENEIEEEESTPDYVFEVNQIVEEVSNQLEDDVMDEHITGEETPSSKPETAEQADNFNDMKLTNLHDRKIQLMEQSKKRIEKLKGLENTPVNIDDFKEKLDVPAYLRKKVSLHDIPHSSEPNVSRYNLNDDNQLLGNNKFLHDNVD